MLKFLILAGLFIVGCASTDPVAPDGSDKDITFEFDHNFSQNLPPSLWSPSKRKVNANYYFLVAEFENLEGNLNTAKELYQAAYHLDPNPLVGQKLVASMAISGDSAQAMIQAKKIALMHPDDAATQVIYGRLLLRQGAKKQAEEAFQKALALDPHVIGAYLGLIALHRSQDNMPAALKVAKLLVENNATKSQGYHLYSRLLLASKNFKKALEVARKAYDLNPQSPGNQALLSLVLEINGDPNADRVFDEVLMSNPSSESLIQLLVDLYGKLSNLSEIEQKIEHSKRKDAMSSRIHLAFIRWELKKYNESNQGLMQLLSQYPTSDRVRYLTAISNERLGKSAKAIELFLAIDPESSQYSASRFRVIEMYRELKKYDEAVALVRDAMAHSIDGGESLYLSGVQILSEQKKYQDAVLLLQESVARFAFSSKLNFYLGVYREKTGDLDGSIDAIKKAIELKPNYHSALNFLGYLYAELGQNLEEAEKLVLQALKYKPQDGTYLDSLGWIYFKLEEFDKAEKFLREASQYAPDEGVIFEHLAEVALAKDDVKGAKLLMEKALSLRLDESDRMRIKKRLNTIEAEG